jgi:hypothetical protein
MLEKLRGELCDGGVRERDGMEDIVTERENVEEMLQQLVEEESRLAAVKNEVDKTRERAIAMHAACITARQRQRDSFWD